MASKVLVKLPVVPFSQRKKQQPEIISLLNRNDENNEGRFQGCNNDKVMQLEQNMKFLQDQHQATLIALHQEVEILRQKNTDLQFQLVFLKGTNHNSNSASLEESENSLTKPKSGKVENVNVTPLQIEILEKDLQDIKTSLNEAKICNTYLSEVIAKQKKMLDLADKLKEKQKMSDVSVQVDNVHECKQAELQACLDDAEAMVKRLVRENEDQRKEIATIKSSNTYSNSNSNRSGSNRNRGSQKAFYNHEMSHEQSQEENYHKFPPLQTQSYWQRGFRSNHSYGHNSQADYHRNSRPYQERQKLGMDVENTVLPLLPRCSRSQEHRISGNYYKDERGRRYTDEKLQRDYSYKELMEHYRTYGKRQLKENQRQQNPPRREFLESPKGPRDSRSAQRQ